MVYRPGAEAEVALDFGPAPHRQSNGRDVLLAQCGCQPCLDRLQSFFGERDCFLRIFGETFLPRALQLKLNLFRH
jgi:hypothetical protein